MSTTDSLIGEISNSKTPRAATTRASTTRARQWRPADLLPDPKREMGWEYKWIRKSTMGVGDPTNMSRSLREGWETCRLEDHPEMMLAIDGAAANSGLIEIGGLILCKMPQEMFDQRQDYYQRQAQGQMESVDSQVDSASDSRMPLSIERNSKTTFGNGR